MLGDEPKCPTFLAAVKSRISYDESGNDRSTESLVLEMSANSESASHPTRIDEESAKFNTKSLTKRSTLMPKSGSAVQVGLVGKVQA